VSKALLNSAACLLLAVFVFFAFMSVPKPGSKRCELSMESNLLLYRGGR